MSRVISKIVLTLVALSAIYFASHQGYLLWRSAPCKDPIAYAIGSFDERFGLSQTQFLEAISEAETIWEKPIGKDLFVYTANKTKAKVEVNLIYDYRQETTKTLNNLGGVVDISEEQYHLLDNKYNNLKREFDNLKSEYETKLTTFNQNNDEYQRKVGLWNKSKRNSQTQFDELERSRLELEQQAANLKTLEAELNNRATELNTLVVTLNHLADTLNLTAKRYNTIGASRGETFTGGLFYGTRGEGNIDIFEFSNHDKLVRVLAHELGHALGLNHINDPKAIMYELNEGSVGVLAPADLVALKKLCGVE